jgi:hypothetical protein
MREGVIIKMEGKKRKKGVIQGECHQMVIGVRVKGKS